MKWRIVLIAAMSCGALGACSTADVDEQFVTSAAEQQGVMLALATMASMSASSDAVRTQAHDLAASSRAELDQLISYARQQSLEDPGRISPAAGQELERLRALSGDAFDRAYLTAALNNNHALMQLIEGEVANGHDEELQHWAEEHLRIVKRAAMELRRVAATRGVDLTAG